MELSSRPRSRQSRKTDSPQSAPHRHFHPICTLSQSRDGGYDLLSPRLASGAHLEGLHKGPEKDSDGVTLSEEFDEPGSSEEAEKTQVDEVILGRWREKG